jgi:hypothetical protein
VRRNGSLIAPLQFSPKEIHLNKEAVSLTEDSLFLLMQLMEQIGFSSINLSALLLLF